MSKEKTAQQLIDEDEDFKEEQEVEGMNTIKKLKKEQKKNAPSRN